ncbi:hypothetical protein [Kitasatospora cinereorecta]|uniref:Secreted protein n=1 Tax=Kitasatospora cinereorecta TaxID=285560 RepID=A0ABW0VFT8_9ACTN
MGVVIPIVLFAALVALVLVAPRFAPFRGRMRAGTIARELTTGQGFEPRGDFALDRFPTAGPPFHYGGAKRLDAQVAGAVDGLTTVSAGYRCRENGSTHFYGVVLVSLPAPVARIEVRHEPAFHSVRVVEPVPGGLASTGITPFDERYRTYVAEPLTVGTLLPDAAVRALLAAPEPCSWRAEGRELLLWRSGGWSCAEALLASLRAATGALRPEVDRAAGCQAAGPTQ